MNLRTLCFELAVACALPAMAQQAGTNDNPSDECKQYLQTPLPTEAAQVATPKQWPDCNSYKLYSGIGTKVDYAAARKCAWSERLAQQANLGPEYTTSSLFGGSAMLTVLYANGEGVEQNKALALRFGCESDLSNPGMQEIEKLPTQAHIVDKKEFRYCDGAMTTFEMNFCAAYDAEIAQQKREDAFEIIMQQWPQKDRDAFKVLQSASENYVQAHGAGEVYQGGTIRDIRTNGIEERQRDKFLAAVQLFESGHLPKGTRLDFEKVDGDLNATYKQALSLAGNQDFKSDYGLIHPEGIRDAERAWLKYRDAWLAFAKLRYSTTDPNAWLTLLTRNRYWSLRLTMCDMGWKDAACKNVADDM